MIRLSQVAVLFGTIGSRSGRQVTIRVTSAERKAMCRTAEYYGMPLSGWVLEIAIETAARLGFNDGGEYTRIAAAADAAEMTPTAWVREISLAACGISALREHLNEAMQVKVGGVTACSLR